MANKLPEYQRPHQLDFRLHRQALVVLANRETIQQVVGGNNIHELLHAQADLELAMQQIDPNAHVVYHSPVILGRSSEGFVTTSIGWEVLKDMWATLRSDLKAFINLH